MNNKLTFTGGEPNMREDDFLRIQESNRAFIMAMYSDYGNTIVSGATTNTPAAGESLTVTDGYVYIDDEMLKVDAGTIAAGDPTWTDFEYQKVTSYEAGGDKIYLDSTARQTWQKNRAVPVSVVSITSGALDCVNGKRYNQPTEWAQPTSLETDWILQPLAELEYKRDPQGVVFIQGGFRKTTAGSGTATVLNIPEGFRPSGAYGGHNDSATEAYISPAGDLYISGTDHTETYYVNFTYRTD